MFDGADRRLLSIVVGREEIFMHGFAHLRTVIVKTPVLFFIHRLQLRMKKAEDRIAETFGLYDQELVHGVRGDIFFVDRLFHPGMRIAALRADVRHQLVILVGDGIFRRQP